MSGLVIHLLVSTMSVALAIPPEPCFAPFRGEDCGGVAKPVVYYWQPGSRCEVGVWRGCLPNSNMFKDEYECVSTCILDKRAQLLDYHRIGDGTLDVEETTPQTVANVTNAKTP